MQEAHVSHSEYDTTKQDGQITGMCRCTHVYIGSYRYYVIAVGHGIEDSQAQGRQSQAGESCNNCHAAFGRIFKGKVKLICISL